MSTARERLYAFYRSMREVIVPELKNSQHVYRDLLVEHVQADSIWLDLGCGHQILPDWLPDSAQTQIQLVQAGRFLVGLDADRANLNRNTFISHRILATLEYLPFRSDTFTLITSNMVIEHVREPQKVLQEIRRVLKFNGFFIFHTPNRKNYQIQISSRIPYSWKRRLLSAILGRKEEDVFPTYYRLNDPKTVAKTIARAGLTLKKLWLLNSTAITVMLGPVVILELLFIKVLQTKWFASWRSNLIAVVQNTETDPKAKG